MSDYPIRVPIWPSNRPVDLTKPGNAPENAPQNATSGASPAKGE